MQRRRDGIARSDADKAGGIKLNGTKDSKTRASRTHRRNWRRRPQNFAGVSEFRVAVRDDGTRRKLTRHAPLSKFEVAPALVYGEIEPRLPRRSVYKLLRWETYVYGARWNLSSYHRGTRHLCRAIGKENWWGGRFPTTESGIVFEMQDGKFSASRPKFSGRKFSTRVARLGSRRNDISLIADNCFRTFVVSSLQCKFVNLELRNRISLLLQRFYKNPANCILTL